MVFEKILSIFFKKFNINNDFNRPFSYSGKEPGSNDAMMQFEEFSNVHNSDRASNAT